jgi:hypothetical protein
MKVAQKLCVIKNFNEGNYFSIAVNYPLPILKLIEIFERSKSASRRPKMSFFTETKKS